MQIEFFGSKIKFSLQFGPKLAIKIAQDFILWANILPNSMSIFKTPESSVCPCAERTFCWGWLTFYLL